ncbi:MAG TPA: hypothetical protein PK339_14300 [Flavitalea sp.]|nr:hypothetical protein [Flavitalea sp.]
MGALQLDNEFMQYWSQLSVVQKESLLLVAKNYLNSASSPDAEADARKRLILKDREEYFSGSGAPSFNWDQIKQMAIDKEKRNAL